MARGPVGLLVKTTLEAARAGRMARRLVVNFMVDGVVVLAVL